MRIYLTALLCLLCVSLRAATVTCTNLIDSLGRNYSCNTMKFTPISKIPQIYGSNTVMPSIISCPVTVSTFSINILAGGVYWAEPLPNNSFVVPVKVLIPSNDTNSYTFNQVISFATNANVFLWTNQYPIQAGNGITFTTNGSIIVISAGANTNALDPIQQQQLASALTNAYPTNLTVGFSAIVGNKLYIGTNTTGITGSGGFSQNITNIMFQNEATNVPAWLEGRVYYDNASHTLSYFNDQPDVTVNVGQEQHVRVVNKTGVTITNGAAVTISGAQGNRPKVVLAQSNTNVAESGYCIIGVATHNITNNAEGVITTLGVVNGIDTRGYTAGQSLFVSTNAGAIVTNRVDDGLEVIRVGIALNSTVSGAILVLPEDATHMDDVTGLTNTLARYVTNNQSGLTFPNLTANSLNLQTATPQARVVQVSETGDVDNSDIAITNVALKTELSAGGTTYTNNTGLPGVVSGSAIGTNITSLVTTGQVYRVVGTPTNGQFFAYDGADVVPTNAPSGTAAVAAGSNITVVTNGNLYTVSSTAAGQTNDITKQPASQNLTNWSASSTNYLPATSWRNTYQQYYTNLIGNVYTNATGLMEGEVVNGKLIIYPVDQFLTAITNYTYTTNYAAYIGTQPQGFTNVATSNYTLTVVAGALTTTPIGYYWKSNGTSVGTNGPVYGMAATGTNFSADYLVWVSNAYGMATSSVATVLITNSTAPATYAFRETFEAVNGYDNSGWTTNSGTPDPKYTATALQGTQSFYSTNGSTISRTAASTNKMSFYFLIRIVTNTPSYGKQILAVDAANGRLVIRMTDVSGTLRITSGSLDQTTVSGLSAGTNYHVWADWDGSSGTASVCFSADGTKPTNGNNWAGALSGADSVNPSNPVVFGAAVSGLDLILDDFIYNNTPIGSNP